MEAAAVALAKVAKVANVAKVAKVAQPTRAPLRTGAMFRRVQNGLGRLVATADVGSSSNNNNSSNSNNNYNATTRLTVTSHQAPFRWIPLRASAVARAGASVVYGSNYGGGLLPGDVCTTTVHAQANTRLACLTQGANRVYRQLIMPVTADSVSRVHASWQVDKDALLVVAPDPVTPFSDAALEQDQRVVLHRQANLCLIDWVAAGRLTQGERWQQATLTNRTQVCWANESDDKDNSEDSTATRPFVVDAVHMSRGQNVGMDWSSSSGTDETTQFNAYATVFLYGAQVQGVVETCEAFQTALASPHTRVRVPDGATARDPAVPAERLAALQASLAGPVLLGATRIPTTGTGSHPGSQQQAPRADDLVVVRLAAAANEDLYRIFHTCLAPLTATFGHSFYQERIRAVHSAAVPNVRPADNAARERGVLERQALVTAAAAMADDNLDGAAPVKTPLSPPRFSATSPAAQWAAHLLTDSSLPTGGFAHSAGLEAAAQLKIVTTPADIEAYCRATLQSTLQLVTPTLVQIHAAVHLPSSSTTTTTPTTTVDETDATDITDTWRRLDQDLHALLVANGPACRASLDQGTALLRLARQWPNLALPLDHSATAGHQAAVFGLVTATWGLSVAESRHLLAYCVARDVLSAAVRLNLIGPLASVPMLARVFTAVLPYEEDETTHASSTTPASSCAPVLEALQPLHDVLAVRLFRT
jgi:urease accessory protein